MDWTSLLKAELGFTYNATEHLLGLLSDEDLEWKPATGTNWMTTGQLLRHIPSACGACFRGFVTGDWGMPDGMDPSDMSKEDMLPTAENMGTVASVEEAVKLLTEDKAVAFEMLARCDEVALDTKPAPAPWDPREMILGHRLLQMVGHLAQHRGQLFYYLKLQGKPVHTGDYFGM
jgi:uncharacterized damage-inducible protein DinB